MNRDSTIFRALQWIYDRRRFVIIHMALVCILAVAIALSLPKTYSSSATILPPEASSLSSMLGEGLSTGIGGAASSLTGRSTNVSKLMSILHSRSLAEQVIEQFNLDQRYGGKTIEDYIDRLHDKTMFTIDDDNMLRITVRAETPIFHYEQEEQQSRKLARDICQFISDKLDSTYTHLQVQNARHKRKLVESRLQENKQELQQAQLKLKSFSQEHSAIALPEQIQSSVRAAADIQTQLFVNKLELAALEETYSQNNTTIIQKQKLVDELNSALADFREDGIVGDSVSILPSFKETPELIYQYAQIQLDLKVHEELHKYLTQQYERAKLEEAQQTPTLQFIDTPRLPTRKTAPPRTIITIILTTLGALFGLAYLLMADVYWPKVKRIHREIKT